jgi:hypothetical protein
VTGQELVDQVELVEPFQSGYLRVRLPQWANPQAYVRLYIVGSSAGGRAFGPWGHLFDRSTQEAIGVATPQEFVLFGAMNTKTFLREEAQPYTGQLDPSDTPTPDA